MCKRLTFLILFLFLFLGLVGQSWGQTQIPVEPGCKLAWNAPMIDDPDNPGTQISQWEHAGDHKGFVFVVRKDNQHVWDKLLEQKFEDPSLLGIDCPSIGVEELGTYSVGITAEDTSLNQSKPAWITFSMVPQDNTPLGALPEICMEGSHKGTPIKTCQKPSTP